MMKIIPILLFMAVSCLSAAGCYYDTQEALYGIPKCDTTNITYLTRIAPIINANCNSCHSKQYAQSLGNGVVLDNYLNFQQQGMNGNLMNDIKQISGANAMPLGGGKLSPCDITIIQHWVDMGTPNN